MKESKNILINQKEFKIIYMKNKIKILMIISSLFLFLLLTGCLGLSTDETQIKQIAKNIEKAIEKKNVDLFMENVSYNYSDEDGGTYDNHINNLPENIISQVELAEAIVEPVSILKIVVDVSISKNDLVLADIYATGKMEITISLKMCIIGCVPIPWVDAEESREFDIDFIKEDEEWKIISLIET